MWDQYIFRFMRRLKDKIYIHFFVDVDGLIINLISLDVDVVDLDESHKLKTVFNKLVEDSLIDLKAVKRLMVFDSKIMGFSTVEGIVEIES